MNNENYARDPKKRLVKALVAAGWGAICETDDELWSNGSNALLIDSIGVFLFQLQNGKWRRTHGLSHNLILAKHLHESCLYFQDFTLKFGG